MDLTSLITIMVAVLILLSGYLLFNDVSSFGKSSGQRRSNRRR